MNPENSPVPVTRRIRRRYRTMINVLNRKQLIVCMDMAERDRVCKELDAARIPYQEKVKSFVDPFSEDPRDRTVDAAMTYTYTIYVDQDDWEKAQFCVV